jgi:hypothetical protein
MNAAQARSLVQSSEKQSDSRLNENGVYMVTGFSWSLLQSTGVYLFVLLLFGIFFPSDFLLAWSDILIDVSAANWHTIRTLLGLLIREALLLILVSFLSQSWERKQNLLFCSLCIAPLVLGWPSVREHFASVLHGVSLNLDWVWKGAALILAVPPCIILLSAFRLIKNHFFPIGLNGQMMKRHQTKFAIDLVAHISLISLVLTPAQDLKGQLPRPNHMKNEQAAWPSLTIVVAPGLNEPILNAAQTGLSPLNKNFLDSTQAAFSHSPTVTLALPMRRELLTCTPAFLSGVITNTDVVLSASDLSKADPILPPYTGQHLVTFRDSFERLWLWSGILLLEDFISRRIKENWVDASPIFGFVSAGLFLSRLHETWNPDHSRWLALQDQISKSSSRFAKMEPEILANTHLVIEAPDLFSGRNQISRQLAGLEEIVNLLVQLHQHTTTPSSQVILIGLPPEGATRSGPESMARVAPVRIWAAEQNEGFPKPSSLPSQEHSVADDQHKTPTPTFEVLKALAPKGSTGLCGPLTNDTSEPMRASENAPTEGVKLEVQSTLKADWVERVTAAPWTTRTHTLSAALRASGQGKMATQPLVRSGFEFLLQVGQHTQQIQLGQPVELTDPRTREAFLKLFSSIPLGIAASESTVYLPVNLRSRQGILY